VLEVFIHPAHRLGVLPLQSPVRLSQPVQLLITFGLRAILRQTRLVVVLCVACVLGVRKFLLMNNLRNFIYARVAGGILLLDRLRDLIIATCLPRTLPLQERREYLLHRLGA